MVCSTPLNKNLAFYRLVVKLSYYPTFLVEADVRFPSESITWLPYMALALGTTILIQLNLTKGAAVVYLITRVELSAPATVSDDSSTVMSLDTFCSTSIEEETAAHVAPIGSESGSPSTNRSSVVLVAQSI